MHWRSILLLGLAPVLASAQLTGPVGPLTSVAKKAATKTCNVLDYGAVADLSTDLGAPLLDAFTDCMNGGLVYIPEGEYAMSTWVLLDKGNAWALQLDGIIYRTGTDGGNMIAITHSSDFEMFSSTSRGAVQGLGYEFHADGTSTNTRLLRLQKVSSFSLHDLAFVDSPAFHVSLDTVGDGEVYNLAIRGGDSGGLDGIDVWGENIWVHDVEVTNKDECVTVKNPSHNILVESIYCNWSGGCAIGSLGGGNNITDITYRNIYTWASNQMFMIKSNGGDGTLENLLLENFIGHGNAYSLDIDSYWANISPADGDGIEFSNITISNWKGTEADGAQRGPIKILCPDGNPCHDITIKDFAMWTETGDSQWYRCQSAYGDGFCLESADDNEDLAAYSATDATATVAPSGYSAPTMAADLSTAFGLTASIPIPTIPTSFYPGVAPYSPLAGSGASGSTSAVPSSGSLKGTPTPAVSSSSASPIRVSPSSIGASSSSQSSQAVSGSATPTPSVSAVTPPSVVVNAGESSGIIISTEIPLPSGPTTGTSSSGTHHGHHHHHHHPHHPRPRPHQNSQEVSEPGCKAKKE